jgi:hypothetical protein
MARNPQASAVDDLSAKADLRSKSSEARRSQKIIRIACRTMQRTPPVIAINDLSAKADLRSKSSEACRSQEIIDRV